MARMTGGEALVASLKQYGVDTIFGLPGVQLDPLFNALYDERQAVRVIHTRHEQGCAYMAFGYAQSTGKVGTCLVVPGPGLLNATAALATAYSCNAPVLCLTGQIPSTQMGRGLGMLHEIPNQMRVVESVTKWARRADHPTQVPAVVREAFQELRGGRVRPVEIEMAPDMMGLRAEVELLDPIDPRPPSPDLELIDKAADLLARSKAPVIYVGSGVFGAEEPLRELAEMLQAPVVMSRNGLGAIDPGHDLAHTMIAGHALWSDADVVLGVGTRLIPQLTHWGLDDALSIVRIDIDPVEIGRVARPAVGIVGDASLCLAALVDAVAKRNVKRPSRADEMARLRAMVADELATVAPQVEFLDAIRQALPEDGIFVEDLTQVGYISRFAFPIYRPRTLITPGYQGTLGYSFPTALGAKVGNPDKMVVSISGDGGFMFNVQELATAVQHNISVVAIVFNDNAFGNVRRMQIEDHGGKVIASDLVNPDFVALAESFGAMGLRVTTAAELGAAIRKGFDHQGPTLIEVPVGEMPSPWGLFRFRSARK